jgi:hypothetical protein
MPQTKRIQPLWKYFKFWMEGVSPTLLEKIAELRKYKD